MQITRDHPIFTQSLYEVTYAENQQPPQLVLDLTTVEELLEEDIKYFFLDDKFQEIFKLDNSTGSVWCTKVLDRESIAEYRLEVGCSKVHKEADRKKRSASDGKKKTCFLHAIKTNFGLLFAVPPNHRFSETCRERFH